MAKNPCVTGCSCDNVYKVPGRPIATLNKWQLSVPLKLTPLNRKLNNGGYGYRNVFCCYINVSLY